MNNDRQRQELITPVLLVPFLIGVPVVLGGGYIIYHLVTNACEALFGEPRRKPGVRNDVGVWSLGAA